MNSLWHPSGALPTRDRLRVYQVVLGFLGFGPTNSRALDGLMGTTTQGALRRYQADARLPVTGQFDAATTAALDWQVSQLTAAGRHPVEAAANAAAWNAAHPVAVTGSHPPVAAIQTAPTATAPAQTVTVPPQVAQMLPPSTVAQLQTMPAPQVQSFVNDLTQKVAAAESGLTSEGTGKDFTAVPLVSPDGTVRAAVQAVETGVGAATGTGTGWWANLTPSERIGYGVGGAVAGVAVIGGLAYLLSEKGRR